MTLAERIAARKPQPKPEPREPAWIARMREGKLPAKVLTT